TRGLPKLPHLPSVPNPFASKDTATEPPRGGDKCFDVFNVAATNHDWVNSYLLGLACSYNNYPFTCGVHDPLNTDERVRKSRTRSNCFGIQDVAYSSRTCGVYANQH